MFKGRKIKKLFKELELNLNNHNFDDALIIVDEILSMDENNQKALYKKALILYNKLEYVESINVLDYLLSINSCIDVFLLKGIIYFNLDDYEKSLFFYKKAGTLFDLNRFNEELYFFIEQSSLLDGGITSNIFICLCNIILDNVDIIEVRLLKAYVLSEIQRNEDALNNVNYILIKDPNNERALDIKASSLIKLKDFRTALIIAEKGLNLNPDNTRFMYIKANVLFELGSLEESEKLCKKCILGDSLSSYYLLSEIYFKQSKYDLALENINILLDKFKTDPDLNSKENFSYEYYWFKSLILLKLNDFEESNKIIDCLIEKEESAKNYCLKAKILYEMDDYENALMFVNKALDLKPDCREAIQLKENLINSS